MASWFTDELRRKYRLADALGSGSFSTVRRATCHGGKAGEGVEVAVKSIDKAQVNTMAEEAGHLQTFDLWREVSILRKLNHPNITKLIEVFDDRTHLHLVLEMAHGGELFDRLEERGHYTEFDAASTMAQVCSALAYIHAQHVVHRDIKPENLLCVSENDDTDIKLCDFGFAARLDKEDPDHCLTHLCGTPGYVAPEILKRVKYGAAVDMWSVGVLTYILLGGYPPFYDDDQNRLYAKIKSGNYEFHEDYWGNVSKEGKDLIMRLLTVNPGDRIKAQEALGHPWISADAEKLKGSDLGVNLRAFKRYNAKRKFKSAGKAVMAARRLSLAMRPDPPSNR